MGEQDIEQSALLPDKLLSDCIDYFSSYRVTCYLSGFFFSKVFSDM